MPQIINTNIASLNAQRNLNKSQAANQTALQRLSSGLRINSAKDDAAGLAISTRFNSQIRGLNVAVRNAGDGISLAQTAEGALGSMNDNLQRIRELAVQSANATNSDVDRDALQSEVAQLLSEVSRTADETDFNGRKLLDGSFNATFQIGANAGQTLEVSISELTAEKLGSAATAGVSAVGNSNALANGDLLINDISIAASKAGDDTSSTNNASASAIAKVEAINRHSEETGVTASVNDNVVSGAEMTGAATSGNLTLNGVAIALTTTTSTSGTRAAVAEAINAVSEQTGVMAINSDSDTGGVQLVAEDGRNIQITFASTLTKASTGIGVDLAAGTAATGTFEGGYTLVADAAVGEVRIDGGNGTGKGDLTNAGLVKGTYDRGVASSVSDGSVLKSSLAATTLSDASSLDNVVADVGDSATLISGGTLGAGGATLATSDVAASSIGFVYDVIADEAGTITSFEMISDQSVASAASVISAGVANLEAYERITFTINDYDSTGAGSTLFMGSAAIALAGDSAGNGYSDVSDRLEYLTDAINNATFGAGNVIVTAELNQAKDGITVTVDNKQDVMFGIGRSTDATITISAGGALTAILATAGARPNSTLVGVVAYQATGANPVTLNVETTAAGGDLMAGNDFVGTDFGNQALSTTGSNEINISVDGTALTSLTAAAGSTVNDIAEQINVAYGPAATDQINAWEDITLIFDANNLDAGDTIWLGERGTASTTGQAVAVLDPDGSASAAGGGVDMKELVDSFNTTSFAAENIDVSATLNSAGEMVLNIRNYSGGELGIVTAADGRGLQQKTTNNIVGSTEQALSGSLAYSSGSGEKIEVTLAATTAGELFTGTSSSTSFDGVNGMKDGDILINDVSIGAAETSADKASAEFASDNTRILSSSKDLSAIAVAAAINKVAEETGVSATINSTEVVGGDGTNNNATLLTQFEVGDSAEIYINGYSAGTVTMQDDGSGGIDTDRAKSDALSVINSISGKSGVVATDNGVSLTMVAEDGRNVSIAIDDQSGADASIGALFGLDAAVQGIGESSFGNAQATANTGISSESATYQTTYGTIRLESAGEFTLTSGANGADELQALGLTAGSYGGAVDGQFLTEIDISTFEGATSALTAIDNAIGAIASQRAVLGAIQNRMESTVSNLAITSENLAAANSRIQDADFAAETAELSRTQVLQQAGISILAQANQGPQQVLSLLG